MLELRRTIPALLGVILLIDFLLRLYPYDPWAPSSYLAASRWMGVDGTWLGHSRYVADHSMGEFVRVMRMSDMLSYRHEVFSTDSLGYRNAEDMLGRNPIVLCGSSFSMGMGLNDSETLAAQLSKGIGRPVYSAALNFGTFNLDRFRRVVSGLQMSHGTLILELLGRRQLTIDELQATVTGTDRVRTEVLKYPFARTGWRLIKGFTHPMFHEAATARLGMLIDNGLILPQYDPGYIDRLTLKNGDPMLVSRDDRTFSSTPQSTVSTVESVKWLREQLKAMNFDLRILLLPNSYTANYEWFTGDQGTDYGGQYLNTLELELRQNGIPVLNGLPILRQAIREGVGNRQYCYWRDDAHWNARGVSVVAHVLADQMRSERESTAGVAHAF